MTINTFDKEKYEEEQKILEEQRIERENLEKLIMKENEMLQQENNHSETT